MITVLHSGGRMWSTWFMLSPNTVAQSSHLCCPNAFRRNVLSPNRLVAQSSVHLLLSLTYSCSHAHYWLNILHLLALWMNWMINWLILLTIQQLRSQSGQITHPSNIIPWWDHSWNIYLLQCLWMVRAPAPAWHILHRKKWRHAMSLKQ